MVVGVLSLQGAITPHTQMLERLGVSTLRVTTTEHLRKIDRIILPGGESTTMLKLLDRSGLWEPLLSFCKTNPVWGTCAGAILLADEVHNPEQRSMKCIAISADRNAYGSQLDSFKASLTIDGIAQKLDVDFIRAPKLRPLSDKVTILSKHQNDAVLMLQENILVSSFHVELGQNSRLHEFFLTL